MQELARRDVDRNAELGARTKLLAPLDDGAACLLEDPLADWQYETRFFRDGHEVTRHEQTALRMFPPHEGFDAEPLPVGQRDHRLVVHSQLMAFQGAVESVLDFAPGERLSPHRLVEDLPPASAAFLGPVHRRVGVA